MKCEQILVSMMYIRVEEPTSKPTKNQWQTYHGVWYHQFKIARKRSKSAVFYVAKKQLWEYWKCDCSGINDGQIWMKFNSLKTLLKDVHKILCKRRY